MGRDRTGAFARRRCLRRYSRGEVASLISLLRASFSVEPRLAHGLSSCPRRDLPFSHQCYPRRQVIEPQSSTEGPAQLPTGRELCLSLQRHPYIINTTRTRTFVTGIWTTRKSAAIPASERKCQNSPGSPSAGNSGQVCPSTPILATLGAMVPCVAQHVPYLDRNTTID